MELIKRALRDGWTREVQVQRVGTSRPYGVMVSLTKTLFFANGYTNEHGFILLSFYRGYRSHRWSVSLRTTCGSKTCKGWWDANYALNSMAAAQKRQDERNAERLAATGQYSI